METVLASTKALCPQYDTRMMVASMYNITASEMDLPKVICRYNRINEIHMIYGGYAYGATLLSCVCLGIPSCILSLVVFCRKDFDSISFLYHRGINVLEMVYAITTALAVIKWHAGEDAARRSLFWTMHSCYISSKLDAVPGLAIEAIIVWVSIERALLCNTPRGFARINHKAVAYAVMVGAVLMAATCFLPLTFVNSFRYNNATGQYEIFRRSFAISNFYNTYSRVLGLFSFLEISTLGPGAVITVLGLISMSKRKHKLMSSAGFQSASAKQLMDQIVVNRQLCLLQICEAITPLLGALMMACLKNLNFETNLPNLVQMPASEAMYNMFRAETWVYLSMIANAMHAISHSTHFYRYLLFSAKVRKAFLRLIFRNKVEDSSMFSKTYGGTASTGLKSRFA